MADLKRSPYIWLVAAPLLWSGNMVFGRVLAQAVPPFTLSAMRWVMAGAVLLGFLRVGGEPISLPRGRAWGPVVTMGLTSVAGFTVLVYISLHLIGSVEASLIQSSTPIFALLLARLWLREELGLRKAAGALLTVVGVAVIVSHGSLARLLAWHWDAGDLLMLLAALLWAASTVAARPAAEHMSPLLATFHSAWIGTLALAPGVVWEWWRGSALHMSPLAWTGVAYVGIFPSAVAFLAWNYGVSRIGAGRASVFNNLLPLFTAILAVLLLGEPLTLAEVLGGLFILVGVSLVGGSGARRTAEEPNAGMAPQPDKGVRP